MRLTVAAFAAILMLAGCRHVPTDKERQGAQIHYDLGIAAQNEGKLQEAYAEYDEALKLDPYFPDVHNAMGLLLHAGFKKQDEALTHYQRALELRPDFSEAKTNLGNLYLDQAKYDEAIKLYEQALNDMRYPTPYIAQGNMGWAQFKKGDVKDALENIKAAVTTNPKFCLGFKNLGLIYEAQNTLEEACKSFGKYREACPEVADAYYREGVCTAKTGDTAKAKEAFAVCQTKAGANVNLRDDCKRLGDALGE
jgi:type IV pilus assembly protein PilF